MGEAYGARTVEKLDGLLADLPNERGRDAGAATPAPGRSGRTFPGLSPFTTRAEFDVTPERVHNAVLESLAPALNKYGYELRHRSPTSLVFERRGRPRWVPFVASDSSRSRSTRRGES